MTQVGIICANALPPVWIFPRVRFDKARMMAGAPTGTLGLVHKSGWMTAENFLSVLIFFKENVRCSNGNPVLLIMDNHESHLSVEGPDYCKGNGITILTLPPHTSNKLQPLDHCVFGPFKKFFNEAVNAWHLSHPNESVTIFELPQMSATAWDRAAIPENIKSGFKSCGISPFDRNIFPNEHFLSSVVSDRPPPVLLNHQSSPGSIAEEQAGSKVEDAVITSVVSSRTLEIPTFSTTENTYVSPEEVRPFPEAPPRKLSCRGRKRGRCMIATDSPEKNEIAERKCKNSKEKQAEKRRVHQRSSSPLEEVGENTSDSDQDSHENEVEPIYSLHSGDFVIVRVSGKNTSRNYVAQIVNRAVDGYDVKFFKRQIASNRFIETDETVSFLSYEETVLKLPEPIKDNKKRFENMTYFDFDSMPFCIQ
ncbi:uncharacterized protein [Periplaneta americana]|uniref:uncharacterized protein n=1 Tax=Periplaneta americana TaxID=6978 RepID=UPI0037E965AA